MTGVKNRTHSLRLRHNLRSSERYLFSAAGLSWLQALELDPLERLEMSHLSAQLELLKAQRKETECQIAQLAAGDERVPHLMQITGVHPWSDESGSSSRIVQEPSLRKQATQSQQLETCPTVHLPLQEFQSVHMAFGEAV